MTALLTQYIARFVSKKLLIVFIVFSLYSLYLKDLAVSFSLSYWEYIIISLSDHYYLLYFMIISFLYLLFSLMNNDNEELIWIRSKTFLHYYLAQLLSVFVLAALFVMLHLLLAALLGLGLRFHHQFTPAALQTDLFILGDISPYFQSPFLAMIAIVFYFISGLTFVGAVFLFLKQHVTVHFMMALFAFFYFLMLVSIRTEWDHLLPFLFLNNYFILHHGIEVFKGQYGSFIVVELIVMVIMLLVTKKYWDKKLRFSLSTIFKHGKTDFWNATLLFSPKNLIVISVLVIVPLISFVINHEALTFSDLLVLQFFGHGSGYFYLIDFIQMIVYNGVPLYLLCYFLEKEAADRSSLVTIRLTYKKTWFHSLIRSACLFLFVYIVMTVLFVVLLALLLDLPFTGYHHMSLLFTEMGVEEINLISLLMITVSSKLMELIFSFFLILLAFSLTGTAVAGFVFIQLLYVLSLLAVPPLTYLPAGLSSLARMQEIIGGQGIGYSTIMVIFTVLTVTLYASLKSGLYQKMLDRGD
ncbi:hypothetical protein [Halalkalibacter oceani]|uniref:hypothetical protein n=1 Tax=Halalkalibacter oceani TaxID=1653776 RepID=UPI003397BB5E